MMKDSLPEHQILPLDQLQPGTLITRKSSRIGKFAGIVTIDGKPYLEIQYSKHERSFMPTGLYGLTCYPLSIEEVEKFRNQQSMEEERRLKTTTILNKLEREGYSITDFRTYLISPELRDPLTKLLAECKRKGWVFMGDSGHFFQSGKEQETCWLTAKLGEALSALNPDYMRPETSLYFVDWKNPKDLFENMSISEIKKDVIQFSTIPPENIRATVTLETIRQYDYLKKPMKATFIPSVAMIIRNKTIDNPLPEV